MKSNDIRLEKVVFISDYDSKGNGSNFDSIIPNNIDFYLQKGTPSCSSKETYERIRT